MHLEIDWNAACQSIHDLITAGDYHGALTETNALMSHENPPVGVYANSGGFLVDIGDTLGDVCLIRRGTRFLEYVHHSDASLSLDPSTYYNLGNGYTALAHIELRRRGSYWDWFHNESHRQAKMLYAEVVEQRGDLEMPQLYVNFGNALDRVGRRIEALYMYEQALAIKSDHPMALGNKAIALKEIAPLLEGYRRDALVDAADLLEAALKGDLSQSAGPGAEPSFRSTLARTLREIESLPIEHPHEDVLFGDLSPEVQRYIEFCQNERLFLTYQVHDEAGTSVWKDTLYIGVLDPTKGEQRFPGLATVFNQIKEDYAVARLLAFQSLGRTDNLSQVSRLTSLVQLSDGTAFNLYGGFMKASFARAFDLLDKIAFFLNRYLGLGLSPTGIYFRTFWNLAKRREQLRVHHDLLRRSNPGIVGLVDISRDLETPLYQKIVDYRRAQTHRCLVLTRGQASPVGQGPGVEFEDWNVFAKETLRLLRLAKAAIFSLATVVRFEEYERVLEAGDGIIRTGFYPTDQDLDDDRELPII